MSREKIRIWSVVLSSLLFVQAVIYGCGVENDLNHLDTKQSSGTSIGVEGVLVGDEVNHDLGIVDGNGFHPLATGSFNLLSPANGAWAQALPLFDWSSASSAVSYELWIDGSQFKTGITNSQYQLVSGEELSAGWHTWYVKGCDSGGDCSTQSSQTWSVQVDDVAPSDFSLLAPQDNQFVDPTTTTGGVVLQDNFDKGNDVFDSSVWSNYSSGVEINSTAIGEPSGSYSLNLDSAGEQITSVDISGQTVNTYSYYYEREGNGEPPDSGENLYFEYYDGSLWHTLETHTYVSGSDTSFTFVSGSFPNPDSVVNVRFRTSAGSGEGWDDYFVDSFKLVEDHYIEFSWIPSSDSGSGLESYELVVDGNSYFTTFTKYKLNLKEGSHNWHLIAYDSVGNYSDTITQTVNIDTMSPYKLRDQGFFMQVYSDINLSNYICYYTSAISSINFDWGTGGPCGESSTFSVRWTGYLTVSSSGPKNFTTSTDDGVRLWVDDVLLIDKWIEQTETEWNGSLYLQAGIIYPITMEYYESLGEAIARLTLPDGVTPYRDFQGQELLSPNNNYSTTITTPTFEWESVVDSGIGLDSYQLIIDGEIYADALTTTTYTLTDAGLENGSYIWTVKAFDKLGHEAAYPFRTINIDLSAPEITNLDAPEDNDCLTLPTPTFSWYYTTDPYPNSGIDHYELWIDGGLSVDNLTTNSTAPGSALADGPHTWYVVAEDNVGNRSQSPTRTVYVDLSIPSAFNLNYPDASSQVSRYPTFAWEPADDSGNPIDYYEVWIDGVLEWTYTGPFAEPQAYPTIFTAPNPIKTYGTHNWFVKAYDLPGNNVSSIQINNFDVVNSAPAVQNLTISPDPAYHNDDLVASYTYFDPDDDPQVGETIRWYRDGILQTAYNDLDTVLAADTTVGETWEVRLQVNDASSSSSWAITNVLIQNRAPSATALSISPSLPNSTLDLTALYTYSDADGDTESGTQIRWYKDSVLQSALNDLTTVPASNTAKWQQWYFTVKPNDGITFGGIQTSATYTIQNAPPVASNLSLTPSSPTTAVDLVGNYDYSDADGESESGSQIRWYKNSVLQSALNDMLTVPASNTAKGEQWYFTVTPNDGSDSGTLQTSSTVTIQNSLPSVTSVGLTPDPAYTNDVLTCTPSGWSDADGDPTGYQYAWYKDSSLIAGQTGSTLNGAGQFDRGDDIYCGVAPDDGEGTGSALASNTITIQNTAPLASGLDLTPDPATTSNDLVSSYIYSDADGDTESGTQIRWYKDSALQSALNDLTTVSASNTAKGQQWYFTVKPSDGTVFGGIQTSPTTTIEDSVPEALNVDVMPTDPTSAVDLTASYVYYDADGDAESGTQIRWYKNGALQTSLNDQIIVPASLTARGERWYFTVKPSDGIVFGTLQQSPIRYGSENQTANFDSGSLSPLYSSSGYGKYWYVTSAKSQNGSYSAVAPSSLSDSQSSDLIWNINVSEAGTISFNFQVSSEQNYDYLIFYIDSTEKNRWSGNYLSWTYASYSLSAGNHTLRWRYSKDVSVSSGSDVAWVDNIQYTGSGALGSVVILNSPPEIANIQLSPANPYHTDDLTASYSYSDADGDAESGTQLLWYRNGSLESAFDGYTIIAASDLTAGDDWYFTVTPGDGFDLGQTQTSPTVYVLLNPDVDGDGLPDDWEVVNFGDTTTYTDIDDPDGDGRDNATEYALNTSPNSHDGPGAPSVNSPMNGSEVATLLPSISVNNANDPAPDDELTYNFEIYDSSSLAGSPVTFVTYLSEGISITEWTVSSELDDNTDFWWRARAFDGYAYGSWSSVANFFVNTVNDAPGISSVSYPANGGEISTTTPSLQVNNANDLDNDSITYTFTICEDYACSVDVDYSGPVSEGTGGSTSYIVSGPLEDNTWYWWQVCPEDEHGAAGTCTIASFFVNIANDAPTAPLITDLPDGSEVDHTDISVIIAPSTDIDGDYLFYEFELDVVNTFNSLALQTYSGNVSGAVNFFDLADNTTHYLRVRADDGAAQSEWVTTSFFINTINDAPGTPVLQNPSQDQFVANLSPILQAINTADLDNDSLTYVFRVYDDESLTALIEESSLINEGYGITSYTIAAELNDNWEYWWTVQAVDEHGLAGEASPPNRFAVSLSNDPPSVPVVFAPENGSIIADTKRPTLIIENSGDVDDDILTYTFEVYSDESLSALVASTTGVVSGKYSVRLVSLRAISGVGIGQTNWQVDVELTEDATYYWRAAAHDGTDRGAYSATASFTIDNGTSESPDSDEDGLTDAEEEELGTDPNDPDSDDDGINDGEEVDIGTNPLDSDSDDDGLNDGEEVTLGSDPTNPDSDGDGISDGDEVDAGTSPIETEEIDHTSSGSSGGCGCSITASHPVGMQIVELLLLILLVWLPSWLRRRNIF